MSLNANLNALRALRRLDEASSALGRSFERLASGSRVNHASDDAAGLAVASSLNLESRVDSQAVRNVSDGMSFLNVADGATKELKGILFRLRELAAQASNGVLSDVQRRSLDKEAQALQAEYNRVVETAKFNGVSVFGGTLAVQAGTGASAVLVVGASVGGKESVLAGDGTFQARRSFTAGANPYSVAVADLNGDGVLDLATADYGGNTASVLLGNGDGTFQARKSFATGVGPTSVAVADFNGDGVLDMVIADTVSTTSVLLGNGDGTFQARKSFATGMAPTSVAVADFDGDGAPDLVTADLFGTASVLLGNGDGTFQARRGFAAGTNPYSVATADFDGDGALDLVIAEGGSNTASVFLGNGDGTFQARRSFAAGATPYWVATADFDGDGVLDFVSTDTDNATTSVFLGNGDGTFQASKSFVAGTRPYSVAVADFDGDGVLDLVTADQGGNAASVLLGNGDGTFQASKSFAVGASPYSGAAADVNGDGLLDLITANFSDGTTSVLLGNGVATSTVRAGLTPLTGVGVATQGAALSAQGRIDDYLDEVSFVSSSIGVGLSRLAVASAHLQANVEATRAAEARITDVETAEESAKLVASTILQQAAAAVLDQALKGPDLVLKILQA